MLSGFPNTIIIRNKCQRKIRYLIKYIFIVKSYISVHVSKMIEIQSVLINACAYLESAW